MQILETTSEFMTPDRVLLLFWAFSAAVQSLPDPKEGEGRAYVFFFKLAHALAANINVVRREVPKEKEVENAPPA